MDNYQFNKEIRALEQRVISLDSRVQILEREAELQRSNQELSSDFTNKRSQQNLTSREINASFKLPQQSSILNSDSASNELLYQSLNAEQDKTIFSLGGDNNQMTTIDSKHSDIIQDLLRVPSGSKPSLFSQQSQTALFPDALRPPPGLSRQQPERSPYDRDPRMYGTQGSAEITPNPAVVAKQRVERRVFGPPSCPHVMTIHSEKPTLTEVRRNCERYLFNKGGKGQEFPSSRTSSKGPELPVRSMDAAARGPLRGGRDRQVGNFTYRHGLSGFGGGPQAQQHAQQAQQSKVTRVAGLIIEDPV